MYALWQMSLGIHLALLAVIGGAWGLSMTQEPVFPSVIDTFLSFLLVAFALLFVVDMFSFARLARRIPQEEN